MAYITTKEASEKWGISTIRITVLANEGRIPGAQRLGRSWLIPATATKPQELKPSHYRSTEREAKDDFSFPLYHFRSDWSYINEDKLTDQQQKLLTAEQAVMECRFDEAYKVLEDIMEAPDDITIEIGSLWNAGICCIATNKAEAFSKIFFRLQMIMSDEFPHRDDLKVIFDSLNTYTENLNTAANEYKYNSDIHDQALPTACLLAGYSQLTKEITKPHSTEVSLLELLLRFVKNTGAIVVAEFLHLYLVCIYYLRDDMAQAEEHAKTAVKIAYENKHYFPLANYYRYLVPVLAPIIEEYPDDFQGRCNDAISSYDENLTAFLSSTSEYSAMTKLKDTDFPYIYDVMMDLSNEEIAKKMNVSTSTIKRRYESIFKKLDVSNKKELRDFLKKNM